MVKNVKIEKKEEVKKEEVKKNVDKIGFLKFSCLEKEKKNELKEVFNTIVKNVEDFIEKDGEVLIVKRDIRISNAEQKSFLNIFETLATTKIKLKDDNGKYLLDDLTIKKLIATSIIDLIKTNNKLELQASLTSTIKQFYKLSKILIDAKLEELKVKAILQAEKDFYKTKKEA